MTEKHRHHSRGFTLLELLVALFVFAMAALVLLKNTNQLIQQQHRLENKTLALWLAENRLAEMRLTQPWPAMATTVNQVSVSQRQWEVVTDVSATSLPTLRKVVVRINPANQEGSDAGSSIISLTGYMGEH